MMWLQPEPFRPPRKAIAGETGRERSDVYDAASWRSVHPKLACCAGVNCQGCGARKTCAVAIGISGMLRGMLHGSVGKAKAVAPTCGRKCGGSAVGWKPEPHGSIVMEDDGWVSFDTIRSTIRVWKKVACATQGDKSQNVRHSYHLGFLII